MLSLLDRYLLGETAKVFAAIIATLLLVTVSMLFLRTLEQVSLGALGNTSMLRFLGLQVLRDSASLLPPAFFIAALVSLGRLARDSELIAFGACGIGPGRLYRSLLLLALPLALLTGWFSLILQPYASLHIQRIEDAQQERATQVVGLQPGRFYQQQSGAVTFYAAALDDERRLRQLFIQDRRSDPPRLILAERGFYQQGGAAGERIVLEVGRRFDGQAGTARFDVTEFDRYTLLLEQEAPVEERRRRAARLTVDLINSPALPDRALLGHRLAAPVSLFALALIAIPLTNLSPRQRDSGRLFLAFLAYFAFFNLQRMAVNWMQGGVSPPWLGVLWYQPLIIVVVFGALIPGSYWSRRFVERMRRWRRSAR